MLQYIDNYCYSTADAETIDEQLSELEQMIKNGADAYTAYKKIRQNVYRQIKVDQLAITRIIGDLISIKKKSETAFSIVLSFLANPLQSYKQIADGFGISKQRVNFVLQALGEDYVWIANLIEIKGQEDAKNGNNRTIFYSPMMKNPGQMIGSQAFIEQPELFQELQSDGNMTDE